MNYAKVASDTNVPQNQQLTDNQVQNDAGGFVYKISKWDQLERFLILGSEGGTYYVAEQKLTRDNAKNVMSCLNENLVKTYQITVDISDAGRAPKNDPAIFVLALSTLVPGGTDALRQNINKVCRTGTHILQLASYIKELRGWGRGVCRAIAHWYESKTPQQLEFQLSKYQSRYGWSHADVIRLSHPKLNAASGMIAKWALGKEEANINAAREYGLDTISNCELAKIATSYKEVLPLIQGGLLREHIPTQFLNEKAVWSELLKNMPMMAMVRNLGKMSSLNLLTPMSSEEEMVVAKLSDTAAIKSSRIHPLQLLLAKSTYEKGFGIKGSLRWDPNDQIVGALESAFYDSFDTVEPTGKRIMISLDVSGSMRWNNINNTHLSCAEASAAMSLVTLKTEQKCMLNSFQDTLRPISANKHDNLSTLMGKFPRTFGGTDCALPMMYAERDKIPVDCFVIYTDNDTWAGGTHPSVALKNYSKSMGIDAKQIVVGMTATQFSIADPANSNSLDVVGFDTSVPSVMREFMV